MGWIKDKILVEHKKHSRLDWAALAEAKIRAQLDDKNSELRKKLYCFNCKEYVGNKPHGTSIGKGMQGYKPKDLSWTEED